MDPETILNDEKVVRKLIECIEVVIKKLDYNADICGGVETVKKQYSLNDVITKPKVVLDSLIVYLYLVHGVDWYSNSWSAVGSSRLTVRPEPGLVVTGGPGQHGQQDGHAHSLLVDHYLDNLVARTSCFLQVMWC